MADPNDSADVVPPEPAAASEPAPSVLADDRRWARFTSIEGLERGDLSLAGEVWLEDLFSASWTTREALKLGVHFIRYMKRPDPAALKLQELESKYLLDPMAVRRGLELMETYGAVDGFLMERDSVRVALHLTMLQRVRVLEAKRRFRDLAAAPAG